VLVVSVQTGQPRTTGHPGAADALDRPWTSAIWKEPVQGRVWAGREGLAGDCQVYRKAHGGPERALLLYSAAHYARWREEWGLADLGPGGFGENLTVEGLSEATVCVGDVFRVGDVRIEVSGPREPCQNLARRHRRPEVVQRVRDTGRSGWYARVVAEGWVEAGLPVALLDRPFPQWPIDRASAVRRAGGERPAEARLLAACPALLADWRARLA
jgi:MOSC domain-containing protein YiiM